jgi:hypothetical protein
MQSYQKICGDDGEFLSVVSEDVAVRGARVVFPYKARAM